MSLENLASTFFQTGPSDDLAVVDIYSTTNTKVKTSLMDRLNNSAGKVINSIISNPSLLNTVASSLTNKGGQVLFDKQSLLSTLGATSLGSKGRSLGADLPSNMMNSIGRSLNNIVSDPRLTHGVMSKIGPSIDRLSYDNLASSQSINSYLVGLTGDANIGSTVGLDAEHAVLGTFMSEAIKIGSVGAFETMLDAYSGKPEYNQVVRGVMAGSFDQSARSGNLSMIQSLVDNLGGRAVLAQLPYANNTILSSYTFPKDLTSGGYRGQLTDLKNVMGSIDPQWDTYNRTVQTVNMDDEIEYTPNAVRRIDSFYSASKDAQDLFLLDDDYKVDMMIAKSYPRIDSKRNVMEKYPNLYFR